MVPSTFELAEAQQAHERAARGHIQGKIVLVVADSSGQDLSGTGQASTQADGDSNQTGEQNLTEPGVRNAGSAVGAPPLASRNLLPSFLLLLMLFAAAAAGAACAQAAPAARVQLYTNISRAETLASFQRFARIVANTPARAVIQHAPADFTAMPTFSSYLD